MVRDAFMEYTTEITPPPSARPRDTPPESRVPENSVFSRGVAEARSPLRVFILEKRLISFRAQDVNRRFLGPTFQPLRLWRGLRTAMPPWTTSSSTPATETAHPTVADVDGASSSAHNRLWAHTTHTHHTPWAQVHPQHTSTTALLSHHTIYVAHALPRTSSDQA
jgi:hypothetical protein